MKNLSWEEVYTRLRSAPPGRLYGVPRGGAVVAGLTGRAVASPEEADVIVDDIVDSGRTRAKFEKYDKPFWSLIERSNSDGWIVFPWEVPNPAADLEDHVVRQLQAIGEDPTRDGLCETPKRAVKSFLELTSGYRDNPAEILSKVFDVPYDEMVVLKDIEFWSLCEHHLLPFHGTAHVGYIPASKVVGISKLARLVHCFSRRLQVQERLTQEIAKAIETNLKPQAVGVVLRATHLCMAMRGVKTAAEMTTSCLLGRMREEPACRNEFLQFVRTPSRL